MRSTQFVKIENATDLEHHLNSNYSEFGGFAEFTKRINLGENNTTIGNAFGVHRKTIKSWREIYNGKI